MTFYMILEPYWKKSIAKMWKPFGKIKLGLPSPFNYTLFSGQV